MNKTKTYILLLLVILTTSFVIITDKEEYVIKLESTKEVFNAGEEIVLTFTFSGEKMPELYFSNSYGSSISSPIKKENRLVYDLTQDLNHRTGFVNWKLTLDDKTSIEGSFEIIPDKKVDRIESYLGPNSIQAGDKDFAMMVLLLHDKYGNPAADSTQATFKSQYLTDESSFIESSFNLISYRNFYATKKAGRILVSSESDNTFSKEYTIDVLPNIPTDFTISTSRNHTYADGNQLTKFSTSIIKDVNDNIVSDGTFVNFFIRNKKGHILKTSGTTIRGIATASMIHPDSPDEWQVKAYIPGMAESDEIKLAYKRAIQDFQISFDIETSTLNVFDLKSFMNQFIPDGQRVTLHIVKDKKRVATLYETSKNGEASFMLKEKILSKGSYEFEVHVAGLSTTISHQSL